MQSLEIQKYGGTSMADAAALMQSASVVAKNLEPGKAILVVNSAMSEVTSQVQRTMRAAVRRGITEEEFRRRTIDEGELGDKSREANYWEVFRAIEERRHKLIDGVIESKEAGRLHQMVKDRALEAKNYLHSMVNLKFLHPGYFDWISAYMGEGSDAPIFHAHLQATGIDAVYYDASNIIVTDGEFGNANPFIGGTRERIKDSLIRDLMKGRVVVMDGYYGADRDGNITTFSRGGSDLSATAMGHALTPMFDAVSVSLYKADNNLAGVMSADPKIVRGTHVVDHMHYLEAGALTAMGGKVIHPKAVHQAVWSGSSRRQPFPIFVKSTNNPELPGTRIDNQIRADDAPVKAISVMRNAIRAGINGWGMDTSGIAAKFFGVFARRGIDIDSIVQSHSKLALDIAYQYGGEKENIEKECEEIREEIKKVLESEINARDVDDSIIVKSGQVIGIVGQRCLAPRSLGKVINGMSDFSELQEPDTYQMMHGKRDISILVDFPEDRLNQLAQSIHDAVFQV